MPECANRRLSGEFLKYCIEHPEQRFWQALRNWTHDILHKDIQYIAAGKTMDTLEDTFYWD
jgi:predicted O-methyltransferase YrrM